MVSSSASSSDHWAAGDYWSGTLSRKISWWSRGTDIWVTLELLIDLTHILAVVFLVPGGHFYLTTLKDFFKNLSSPRVAWCSLRSCSLRSCSEREKQCQQFHFVCKLPWKQNYYFRVVASHLCAGWMDNFSWLSRPLNFDFQRRQPLGLLAPRALILVTLQANTTTLPLTS